MEDPSNPEAVPIGTGEGDERPDRRRSLLAWLAVGGAGVAVAVLAITTLGGGSDDHVTSTPPAAQVAVEEAPTTTGVLGSDACRPIPPGTSKYLPGSHIPVE